MSWRWTTWLALGLWLTMIVLTAVTVAMKVAGWHGADNTSESGLVALFVAFLAFATMGALVAAHVPRNPLGWIFLGVALGVAANGVAETVAYHGLADDPGSIPGAIGFAWYYSWAWYPTVSAILLVLLLYPTGSVPSPRWRPVLWSLVAVLVVVTLAYMFLPGPLDGAEELPDNPIGIGWVGDITGEGGVAITVSLATFVLLAAASVIVRFRRARGDERQQLKWMAFAAVFLVVTALVSDLAGLGQWGDLLFSIAVVQLPIAFGIAMFKYRLYEIDRLINKTLVYGVLTVILGGAYVGLVILGQWLASSLTGGGNLAIAISTLIVAALFLPLRSRIQRLVDRRFYRRRYDAQRTLEGFGARLREQIELEALTGDLQRVVEETMQPSQTSLWLRGVR